MFIERYTKRSFSERPHRCRGGAGRAVSACAFIATRDTCSVLTGVRWKCGGFVSLDRLKFSVGLWHSLSQLVVILDSRFPLAIKYCPRISSTSSLDIQDSAAVLRHLPIAACLGLKTKAWCRLLFLTSCLWLHLQRPQWQRSDLLPLALVFLSTLLGGHTLLVAPPRPANVDLLYFLS